MRQSNPREESRARSSQSTKKLDRITGQTAAQNTTAPVLGATGKPSTWLPVVKLAELPQSHMHVLLVALPLKEGKGAKHSPPGDTDDKYL